MIVVNYWCNAPACRAAGECWRVICPNCGGYIAGHATTRERAENLTDAARHVCGRRPFSLTELDLRNLADTEGDRLRARRTRASAW